jgi:hypothetical protein
MSEINYKNILSLKLFKFKRVLIKKLKFNIYIIFSYTMNRKLNTIDLLIKVKLKITL